MQLYEGTIYKVFVSLSQYSTFKLRFNLNVGWICLTNQISPLSIIKDFYLNVFLQRIREEINITIIYIYF